MEGVGVQGGGGVGGRAALVMIYVHLNPGQQVRFWP